MILNDFECDLISQQTLARFELLLAMMRHASVNLSDEFRCSRPSVAVNKKNIDTMHRVIEKDNHLTYREIQPSLGKDMSQVQLILHKHLGMNTLCPRWIHTI
ncbi:hypothetical protein EVAR_2936_1 [Eumeta japonica]|uniref:Histone-lysine N-methyltransferase SETMAR n=1 Tax=Eumeta variegata TaxID=151549 RepID=A0A4C1T118_EUMVA|nr:hypothetical protein EVAR_2936_1 [Eumeta japonica]